MGDFNTTTHLQWRCSMRQKYCAFHFLHSGKPNVLGHMRHARAHHTHVPPTTRANGSGRLTSGLMERTATRQDRDDSRTDFRWPVQEPQGSSATVHALASVWADSLCLSLRGLTVETWVPLPRVVMVQRAVAPKSYVHCMPAYPSKPRITT